MRDCQDATSTVELEEEIQFSVFPNPFVHNIKVEFEMPRTRARLSILDGRGSEVLVAFDREIAKGKHRFNLETSRLAAGNYYVRLTSEFGQMTKMIVKVR